MSRNFGAGSRDMSRAIELILYRAAKRKDISFSTARTLTDRARIFVRFLNEKGIGRLERVTPDLLVEFGRELAWEVDEELMRASYAQNLVSAANTAMSHATRGRWKRVFPTRDCGIPKRCAVRQEQLPHPDQAAFAIQSIFDAGLERAGCIAQLASTLGLRCLEASLLDCQSALNQAKELNEITIYRGTKGGRKRTVSIEKRIQIEALERASAIQGSHSCLIPADSNWIQFKRGEVFKGRKILTSNDIGGYRELRSLFAGTLYTELTGFLVPCDGGVLADIDTDRNARLQIAAELGHGRPQITNEYIGGRR